MIVVHDIFICKPGNASKLAKLFKEAMAGMSDLDCIMTDMTGQYNRVIMVTKYQDLAVYEKSFEKYMHDTEEMKKMKEMMKGYHELYLEGSREIFRVM
jgi:tRNA A-37 threonylcarbamoyl transferase component Bud32